ALLIDAAASGAMGVLLAVGAGVLESMLGLSVNLLRGVGVFLIPFAAFLVWLAPRAGALRAVVRTVVVGNVLWVLASILLLASGWVVPTTLGTVFVVAQAAAVAVFAYLEHRAGARNGGAAAEGPAVSAR
ncbi:MAG TPA: hypothetical protein VFZ21_13530, partial [Gemmatimonadaceae bacterium]|nr:hypothetical protein [Gemmatimonadaceae bacterium]